MKKYRGDPLFFSAFGGVSYACYCDSRLFRMTRNRKCFPEIFMIPYFSAAYGGCYNQDLKLPECALITRNTFQLIFYPKILSFREAFMSRMGLSSPSNYRVRFFRASSGRTPPVHLSQILSNHNHSEFQKKLSRVHGGIDRSRPLLVHPPLD